MHNNLSRWGARFACAAALGIGLFSLAATATAAPLPTTAAVSAGFHCPDNGGLDGYFANTDDPTLYWHCSNGHPYQKQCPANLHWDDTHKRCDWPHIAANPAGALIEPVVDDTPVGQVINPIVDQVTDILGG